MRSSCSPPKRQSFGQRLFFTLCKTHRRRPQQGSIRSHASRLAEVGAHARAHRRRRKRRALCHAHARGRLARARRIDDDDDERRPIIAVARRGVERAATAATAATASSSATLCDRRERRALALGGDSRHPSEPVVAAADAVANLMPSQTLDVVLDRDRSTSDATLSSNAERVERALRGGVFGRLLARLQTALKLRTRACRNAPAQCEQGKARRDSDSPRGRCAASRDSATAANLSRN